MLYKIETTATFDRGMKSALKRETHAIPEYEAIAELISKGLDQSPSRNLEKLYDRPDGPVYSIRIDAGRRLTFQIVGDRKVRLRAVGEHDETYRQDARL